MTKAKRLSLLALALILMLSAVFSLAACGDDEEEVTTAPVTTAPPHVHAYTDTVVPPTCTADGYTKHTCACGHTYNDTTVPAAHTALTSKITRYPTTLETGVRRFDCSACGASYTEDIAVVTSFVLPSLTEAIAKGLPQGSYAIETEDAAIVHLFSRSTSVEGVPASDSTNNEYYALRVASLSLNVAAGLTGELELDIGIADLPDNADADATATELDTLGTLVILLNGDTVAITLDGEDQTYNISDLFYEAVASENGMTVEELREMLYIANSMETYLPAVTSFFAAIGMEIGEKIPEAQFTPIDLLEMIAGDLVASETVGTVTTTTLDFAAAVENIAAYADKSLADIIDESYGEGSATALFAYINSLPDMTVAEIVDLANTIADAYEVDIDTVLALVNLVAFLATEEDFDVEAVLAEMGDKTLAEIVTEGSTTTPEQFKTQLNSITLMLASTTLNEFYHNSNCDPTAHAAAGCDALEAAITAIGGMLDANLALTVVTDDGVLTAIELETPILSFAFDEDGAALTLTDPEDGEIILEASVAPADGDNVLAIVTGWNDYELSDAEFSYALLFSDTEANLFDITATPGVYDAAQITEDQLMASMIYDGENYGIAIFTPEIPASAGTPAILLQLQLNEGGCSFVYANNLDELNPILITAELLSDETGFTITVTDAIEEAILAEVDYVFNSATGEFVLAITDEYGAVMKLVKEVEEGVVTFTIGMDDEGTLVPYATLALTDSGFALSFSTPAADTTIAVDTELDGNTYVCTVTLENATFGSSDWEEDWDKDAETWIEVSTTDIFFIDGTYVFSYTPAAQ